MKVWVVIQRDYWPVAVYDNEEAAKAHTEATGIGAIEYDLIAGMPETFEDSLGYEFTRDGRGANEVTRRTLGR